jgi:hypothetical protein
MGKTIIEALKNHDLVIHFGGDYRWMFWDNGWKVYEHDDKSGMPKLVISTQDEKEAIEALVSES